MLQNATREWFKKLKESLKDKDQWFKYQSDLKEEGIKALFVIPVLVEQLGFSDFDSFKFEDVQGSNQGFADITLNDNFLIETKKFNLLSDPAEFVRAEKQISKYIRNEKDKIFFGLLTDGVLWALYVDKKYINLHGNENADIPELVDDCPLCVKFSISDDNFLNLLMMFHNDVYEENIKKTLIKAIVNKIQAKPGRVALNNMFTKNENMDIEAICGKSVQEQIDEYFKIEKGEFFDDLISGAKKIGSLVRFDDEYITLEVSIVRNGHIKVNFKNCKLKMEKQIEALSQYPKLIEYLKAWQSSDETSIFPSRVSLYKSIKDQKSLQKQDEFQKRWTFI
jgi:hypothetical protein